MATAMASVVATEMAGVVATEVAGAVATEVAPRWLVWWLPRWLVQWLLRWLLRGAEWGCCETGCSAAITTDRSSLTARRLMQLMRRSETTAPVGTPIQITASQWVEVTQTAHKIQKPCAHSRACF